MVEKFKKYRIANFANGPKAKILMSVLVVLILASVTFMNIRKTVTVVIDGNEETFVTYKGTVEEVLTTQGIKVSSEDKVQPELQDIVSENEIISIKKAVLVSLTVGEKKVEIKTAEDTIEGMLTADQETLKTQGVEINKDLDEISPALNTKITPNLNIDIVKVEIKNVVENEVIDFDVVEETDSDLDISIKEVVKDGAPGQKEVTYAVVYKNGVEVSRGVKASKVLAEPVNKVVVQGTKRTVANRSGQLLDYKSVLYVESTAYTGGGTTATGTIPVRNSDGISTIAVDPRVIPLGSLVYVEGYGQAIASDTGGAIKGNIVDVYLNSNEEAVQWGRKYNVAVYVIAHPGEW